MTNHQTASHLHLPPNSIIIGSHYGLNVNIYLEDANYGLTELALDFETLTAHTTSLQPNFQQLVSQFKFQKLIKIEQ